MPFYRERLLSAWGNDHVFEVGTSVPEIDPEIQSNARQVNRTVVAPNPRKTHRNQMQRKSVERAETNANGKLKPLVSDSLGSYNNVKIIYGNFGIKDFDFQ